MPPRRHRCTRSAEIDPTAARSRQRSDVNGSLLERGRTYPGVKVSPREYYVSRVLLIENPTSSTTFLSHRRCSPPLSTERFLSKSPLVEGVTPQKNVVLSIKAFPEKRRCRKKIALRRALFPYKGYSPENATRKRWCGGKFRLRRALLRFEGYSPENSTLRKRRTFSRE